MTPVPPDIWACCYVMSRVRAGKGETNVCAFMIRADTHAAATAKAKRLAENAAARLGYGPPHVCVNEAPGEPAVVDLNAHAYTIRTSADGPEPHTALVVDD